MDKLKQETEKGFSTIEIMIAIVVVLTALSASTMLSLGNGSILSDAETNSEALSKAQELVENAQSDARKDFQLVVPKSAVVDDIYTKSLSVSTTNLFTKLVTGTVTWNSDHNRAQKVNISSIVTDFENAVGGNTCDSIPTGDWTNPVIKNTTTDFGTLVGNSSGTYPISGIDIFKSRLYASVKGVSQSSTVTSPQTADGTTGPGSLGAWNNSNSIKISDNDNSSVTTNGFNISKYLKATNFGFTIPAGATILGIKVDIEKTASGNSSANAVIDSEVKIVKSDGTIGTINKGKTNTSTDRWSSGETTVSYGGNSDIWSEAWKASDINNSNFGVVISVTGVSPSNNRRADIDSIKITITYAHQLYVMSVTNPIDPTRIGEIVNGPTVLLPATGFSAITTDGTHSYVAINAGPGTGQFAVINTSGTSHTPKALISVPLATGSGSQATGNTLFYKNGYVYLGLTKTATGPEFHIIDVHNPENPTVIGHFPAIGSMGNSINSIYVKGKYAYLATPNTQELTILDISNPTNPIQVGGFDAPGGSGNGKVLYSVGDTLYLGRTNGGNEFYLLDNKNPASTVSIGSKGLGGSDSLNDIVIRNNLAFLATGTASAPAKLQIMDISNPANIVEYAPITTLSTTGNSIDPSLDCEGNYIYSSVNSSTGKGILSIISTP